MLFSGGTLDVGGSNGGKRKYRRMEQNVGIVGYLSFLLDHVGGSGGGFALLGIGHILDTGCLYMQLSELERCCKLSSHGAKRALLYHPAIGQLALSNALLSTTLRLLSMMASPEHPY